MTTVAFIDCYVSGIIYLGVRSYGFACRVGSIRTVVDEEGKEVFEAKYDAWGVQEVTLNAIGLRRGYTGHEMLSEYGIINMNGRLYDPMLGRFFSPDSFVQFPGFTQSYNRYSYCLNNPLKFSALSGGSFGSGFAAGAISSAAGSLAQGFKMNTMQMILTSTAAGGIAAWASGGNFLSGAMQGLCVGLLNHAEHDGGAESTVNETPEDTIEVGPNLEWENSITGHFRTPVVCTASASGYADARFNLAMASTIVSSIGSYGKSLEKFSQNTTIGENGMFYYAKKNQRSFYGNQYIRTKKAVPIGKTIVGKTSAAGKIIGGFQIFVGVGQDIQTYVNEGTTNYYHTAIASGEYIGSYAGGWVGVEIGGRIGGFVGSWFGGIGAIPGALIGGTVGGIIGAWYGVQLGGSAVNYLYFK